MPFIEIQEKSKNKSFVAEKAVTHSDEKKVSDKAPVTKVKIINQESLENLANLERKGRTRSQANRPNQVKNAATDFCCVPSATCYAASRA